MSKLSYNFLFILGLALFFGCEKEVVLDLEDDEQRLAIFSLFTPNNVFTDDDSFIVEVTSTQSILNNKESIFINDAEVTIISTAKDNPIDPISERLTSSKTSDDRVVYTTDMTLAKDGFEYELNIDHPDFPSITAKSFVPPTTNISNIDFSTFKKSKENELPGFTRYFTNVDMEIPNNIKQEDFFHLLVWQLRSDGLYEPINIGAETLQEQLGTDVIVVNVNNSPVFFGAHFSDERFTGINQNINFDISFLLTEDENPSEIKVELRSVSREYHRYFIDGFRLSQAGNNPFFVSADNITNNIEGGFGIFAGYSASDADTPFRK